MVIRMKRENKQVYLLCQHVNKPKIPSIVKKCIG